MAFEVELADGVGDVESVVAAETGVTVVGRIEADATQHAFERQVLDTVDTEEFPDFLVGPVSCHQFGRVMEIDAEEAAVSKRRTADPEMDFLCAGPTKLQHLATCGRASNDRVIDNNQAFAVHDFPYGVEFDLHAGGTLLLSRPDERSANVVIANDAYLVGNTSLYGIADLRSTQLN